MSEEAKKEAQKHNSQENDSQETQNEAIANGDGHAPPANLPETDGRDAVPETVAPVEVAVPELETLACEAIAKHFRKATKYKDAVLEDRDPENLHQMRVGMRRLRSALRAFEPAVRVPNPCSIAKIGKIARILGAVRDCDVLAEALEQRYAPDLEGKERKRLDRAVDRLHKQRRRHFDKMERTLNGSRYREFEAACAGWLANPQLEPVAALPIVEVLPDLMLPLVAQLLLHPGWWAEVDTEGRCEGGDRDEVALHELRKQMKRVRYQSEFFAPYYPDSGDRLQEFQDVQTVLGELQDLAVLRDYLTTAIGKGNKSLETAVPTVCDRLAAEREAVWQRWYPLRDRYRDFEFRRQLRSTFARATAS